MRANNSPFKEQYEREKTKGLSNKAALCAVARKMAKDQQLNNCANGQFSR